MKANVVRTAVGSYEETDNAGVRSNHLDFDFSPKMVILVVDEHSMMKTGTVLIAGQTSNAGIGTSYSSGSCLNLTITWEKNGVSWYGGDAERQLNKENCSYFYFAIG